ncbi:hypothetical protein OVY01_09215 [Robbsia sp. Bb-Pol-6]|uniref:Uncharacterized protein n=1 Tax=Robbsia betulipollinis TaxID=2981849 RepID=A0ABT3ZLX6_9BURK|nr:hypothetical protein [Robbsia betulipollinis]MCY0387412.1 hypothetical protein [Robbsia betulipollinis]
MADVLRNQAGNIPVTVVTIDPMALDNELGEAIIANKPGQIMRVHTVSVRSNQYGPLASTWQLDIDNVSQHPVAPSGTSAGQVAVTRRTIYRVRVSGPTCMGSLSSEGRVVVALHRAYPRQVDALWQEPA